MATHRLPREVIALRKGAVVPRHQTRHRAHSPEVEIHHRVEATANNSYLSQKKGGCIITMQPPLSFQGSPTPTTCGYVYKT